MDSDSLLNSLHAIFDRAVESPVSEREKFLNDACRTDVKLRAAVESLLAAHDRAGSFLADPVITVDLFQAREQLSPGTRIGKYALIRVIGEGGYGTVYLAEQDPPLRRNVALKVIKPGMDSAQVVARFEVERQALATMDHPNIAKVFDAGSTSSGYPYFVMELVDGVPITEFCRVNDLDIEARLKLFTSVCAAVHHAHEKGIIHRDLKPGNVSVILQDGNPMPKVIDFGIAKALLSGDAKANHPITLQPQFLGTPQYMSPEQARISGDKVDWRSDVYSLGALLYELLTDSPPFDRAQLEFAAVGEVARILQEVDPPAPSARLAKTEPAPPQLARHQAEARRRVPLVRGDLDRIVMKAMEKDAAQRYQSAAALAEDVAKHLQGQPVRISNTPWTLRLRRITYRRRRSLGMVMLLILGGIVGAATREWWPLPAQIAGSGATRTIASPFNGTSRELIYSMAGKSTSFANGIYELHDEDRIYTTTQFAPPIAFRLVARTNSTNIRIGYAANQIIFNWARNPDRLIVEGGPGNGHIDRGGQIPVNEWVTIDLVVKKDSMSIAVNGDLRYRINADFSQINQPLSLFQGAGSTVQIRSFLVGLPK
jgi:serine/threonine protein kinase